MLPVATVLVAAAAFLAAGPNRDPRVMVFLGVLEGTVVLAWLAGRIRQHLVWPLAMAAAGLTALAVANAPIAGFGVLMALANLGARFPLAHGVPIGALAVLLFEVVESRWRTAEPAWVALETLGFAGAFVVAVGVRQIRQEQARTRAALAELEQGREVQARAARVADRVRLAREVHEVLGQTLSALALQLEGTHLLLMQRPEDPACLAAVERAHGLARECMEEARRAAAALRGDRLPIPGLLVDLVSDFERDTGTEAHLQVDGTPFELSPEARLAVYRTAQEALRNVGKHARAGRVEVRLRYEGDGAELIVENDGGPPLRVIGGGPDAASSGGGRPGMPRPGGLGLPGLRERAELLGGRLEAGPTEQGFRVHLWVAAGDDSGLLREAVVDVGLSAERRHPQAGLGDWSRSSDNGLTTQS